MIQVRISSDALDDLKDGFQFYELQEPGLGNYFLSQLRADIDGLKITTGIHRKPPVMKKYLSAWRNLSLGRSKAFPRKNFGRHAAANKRCA